MADRWQSDRSRGVFETLLVVDGEPVELDGHLLRLRHSLEEVYSQELPPQLQEEMRRAAAGISLGRLRATLSPARDGLRLDLIAGRVEPEAVFPTHSVKLRAHPIAGGLGRHKWAHRSGIDRPAAGEEGALIVDHGEVLEAGWANVFAVRQGALFTPPLDGRLLPGVTRAKVIELARAQATDVHEQPVMLEELQQADEVFLTNSIRGIEAVDSIEEKPLGARGRVSALLREQLRSAWVL
jgi:para-aminobenzoate synthetase / 4-amino-4-deoxychorismate lyase